MTADRHNFDVVDIATSFGSAVLGTLKYDDDEHNWLMEFGYVVAHYEYLRTYPERDRQDQACLNGFIKRINDIGAKHGIVNNFLGDIETAGLVADIRKFVKVLYKENSYALFLISGCSWYLSKSYQLANEPRHSSQLKCAAWNHLRELKSGCPSISINQTVLWARLNQKLSECRGNSVHDIRELVQELCRALQVLLISADPTDTTSARPDGERRSLGKALSETMFRHKVNVENVPGCHVEDISSALIQHKPDILHFLGHGDENGIYFEDGDSKAKLVRMEAFADLLGQSRTIKLVILNTCYSQSRSQCIADAVGCLIGMEGKIRNKDAIKFTELFYGALGNGLTVKESFKNAGFNMKLDDEARFQAHLLQKGQASNTISTLEPAGGALSEYRGLFMNVTHWPFVLSIWLCVLATAAYFHTIYNPVTVMMNLWCRPWNASNIRNFIGLDYFDYNHLS